MSIKISCLVVISESFIRLYQKTQAYSNTLVYTDGYDAEEIALVFKTYLK